MKSRKKIKIGFDLDGVIIDKPPIVPRFLLEKLVRQNMNKHLAYRYPSSEIERQIRILSHHPIFRPPIQKNVSIIKQLYKSKDYKLYVVSSRYSFLKKRTEQWKCFYCNDSK